MKTFYALPKSHAGADEKHDINFHWPYRRDFTQEKVQASLENIFKPKNYTIDIQHFHIKLEQKNSKTLPF